MSTDNVAYKIQDLSSAIRDASKEIGKEGAFGPGAIEGLAIALRHGCEQISDALHAIADKMPE